MMKIRANHLILFIGLCIFTSSNAGKITLETLIKSIEAGETISFGQKLANFGAQKLLDKNIFEQLFKATQKPSNGAARGLLIRTIQKQGAPEWFNETFTKNSPCRLQRRSTLQQRIIASPNNNIKNNIIFYIGALVIIGIVYYAIHKQSNVIPDELSQLERTEQAIRVLRKRIFLARRSLSFQRSINRACFGWLSTAGRRKSEARLITMLALYRRLLQQIVIDKTKSMITYNYNAKPSSSS